MGTLTKPDPWAALADPTPAGLIDPAVLNGRRYIDITFTDTGGSTLDPTTVLDAAREFVLLGAAAAGVTVNGSPTRIDDDTYRYAFTGDFTPGQVLVHGGRLVAPATGRKVAALDLLAIHDGSG